MRAWVLLAMSVTVMMALAASGQEREWTSEDGKKITGEIKGVDGDQVTLKAGERTYVVPLARLSELDQAFVKGWALKEEKAAESKSAVDLLDGFKGLKLGDWPEVVAVHLSQDLISEEEREDKQIKFVYESPHFRFRCSERLGKAVVREFAHIFEATHDLVAALPLGLKPMVGYKQEKFEVRLFPTTAAFKAVVPTDALAVFVSRTSGEYGGPGFKVLGEVMVPLPALGVEWTGARFIIDRDRDDNSVLMHEVAHQMTMWWLSLVPDWMVEGFAEMIASTPYKKGTFRLKNHLQGVVARVKGEGGGAIDFVAPSQLLGLSTDGWSAIMDADAPMKWRMYPSANVLMTYFAYLDGEGDGGHLTKFLQALAEGGELDEAQQKHLWRGRSPEEMNAAVSKAWAGKGLKMHYLNH